MAWTKARRIAGRWSWLGKAAALPGQIYWSLLGVAALMTWVAAQMENAPTLTSLGWLGVFFAVAFGLVFLSAAAVAVGWLTAGVRDRWRLGTDARQTSHLKSAGLARVQWKQGLRLSRIDMPWELSVRIEFQTRGFASCYARWGNLEYYMSGGKAWEWSTQKDLMAPQTVGPGKVIDFLFASIDPEVTVMSILDGKASGHPNHEELICCEIVISVEGKSQRERRYYGLVAGQNRLMAVLIDEHRFDGAGDA